MNKVELNAKPPTLAQGLIIIVFTTKKQKLVPIYYHSILPIAT